jgi:hypothetical protein
MIAQKAILLFILGLSTVACAEIISGTAYLNCDSNISFSPLHFSANPKIENTENSGYVYSCAAKLNSSFDLFVATEFRMYACAFTCRNIAIGSPRPFYISLENGFAPATFSHQLLLNDTNRFIKCDTVRIDCHSPGKRSWDSTCDSTHCYLPHIGTALANQQFPPYFCFLVIKNSYDQWVCVKFDSVMRRDEFDSSRYYIAGYRLNWYLQTDSTLDFSAVVSNQKMRQHLFIEKPNWKTSRIYTVDGKQLSGMQKATLPRYNGILLIETDHGIRREISCRK